MHLAFNRLMFLTYPASDFNNWEKWEILLYVFIILNGRFSFKLNFILGWNSTRFTSGWNSRVNRNFFILRWDFISVTCKRTLRGYLHVKFHPGMKLVPGWNHPCLWWNFSYCLHVFFQIKFYPRMKFYSFHLGMKLTCKQKFFHPGTSFIPG